MNSRERRADARVNIRVPLRFRVLNNTGATEQTAESENISQRGIYFATNVPLNIGTPVEVSLRMPRELGAPSPSDVKCLARVVHVQAITSVPDRSGIGVHIERYVAGASAGEARERWTS